LGFLRLAAGLIRQHPLLRQLHLCRLKQLLDCVSAHLFLTRASLGSPPFSVGNIGPPVRVIQLLA
jgi:hypothetical protein